MHVFRSEQLILGEYVAVKAVRSESFVEVRLLSCLSDVIYTEGRSRVDLFICHLFIVSHPVFQMLLHMIWPLVDLLEIAGDDLVNLHAVFEYF